MMRVVRGPSLEALPWSKASDNELTLMVAWGEPTVSSLQVHELS